MFQGYWLLVEVNGCFSGNPFSKALLPNLFGSTGGNFNVCIAGQSGSGKPVFMNELMVGARWKNFRPRYP